MSRTLPLKAMTHCEKLAAMESLWEDLARTPESIESPTWHQEILDERRQRITDGKDRFADWATAKAKLRSQMEGHIARQYHPGNCAAACPLKISGSPRPFP